ncbi:dTDP-4-amino-4,6-dideoxygalactose transaminase [Candidatus Kuenenia stuttgartiensis]|uniref:dTDP-4-amino-4,6-dideoxygalactose transaminase n=1 Tax=Kuenenia stuttgartiensis TaxID=174633 RepID=UPI00146A75A6|nr:dTDP-4-amino-4,6-dideoxygalactose transaminase [Candidatus Kuenenia stuttgartiensis]
MILFNIPLVTGKEIGYIQQAIVNKKFCGDGSFTKKCNEWLEDHIKTKKALLTTSCTHALEMAAILADVQEGDEVIMPSFTFVTTANAFVLKGAKVVFVDIRPETMNVDETKIEEAITDKTKAIIPVHYAGICCDMDVIIELAKKYNFLVIEDAAQGIMANYKGKALGSIGHIGCYSFHETKNYTCGEGGAILINDERFLERAEIIREKGTNRLRFLKGQVDKYTWVDIGSSYLPSELNAAFLYANLQMAEEVKKKRLYLWNRYYVNLEKLKLKGSVELPYIPSHCEHNAHMFYIKLKDIEERQNVIKFLKDNGIQTVFHYIPLHSSLAGKRFGRFFVERTVARLFKPAFTKIIIECLGEKCIIMSFRSC